MPEPIGTADPGSCIPAACSIPTLNTTPRWRGHRLFYPRPHHLYQHLTLPCPGVGTVLFNIDGVYTCKYVYRCRWPRTSLQTEGGPILWVKSILQIDGVPRTVELTAQKTFSLSHVLKRQTIQQGVAGMWDVCTVSAVPRQV